MQRLVIFAAVILWCTPSLLAQDTPFDQPSQSNAATTEYTQDLQPVDPIPLRELRGYDVQDEAYLGAPTDSLSEAQILRRLGRVYQYQSDILVALADGEIEEAEELLDLAMTEIGTLSQQDGITDRVRYRELYRTIVSEYEGYYGIPDSMLAMPYGGIYQFRADMFAALEEVEMPLLEDVSLPDLGPMETTFPMTMNRLVQQSIDFLLRERRDKLNLWMTRADTYFPMMDEIFEDVGVPPEMKYLAVIESGLNPTARSWAKAVGMWQFIAATGKYYGLDVNTWVDERMDPEKATRAAAEHLLDLHKMYYKDWQVAIAGYNCSPRCIKRAIRRTGKTNPSFWDIYPYLPRQTRNYVPGFIAASLIMTNPDKFGLDAPKGPRYEYDLVPVQGMLSFDDVAKMAGTDKATVRALNPELRRSTLPPTNSVYMLRLPVGSYTRFAEAFEKLPASEKKPVGEYVVRRGDSLGKIASTYGLSVTSLKNANGLRSNTIHPGQSLIVPVPNYSGEVKLADAEAVTVKYGTRTIRPIEPNSGTLAANTTNTPIRQASANTSNTTAPSKPTTSSSKSTASSSETRIVYTVRRGDSLGKIGQKYGVSVKSLQQWNNIRGTKIKVGQKLYLYPQGNAPASSQPEKVVYKVKSGDNLTNIAKKYSVSVSSIRTWNNLRSSTIRPGQRLTIHPGQKAANYTTYKVRSGDTLGKIASRNRTTVTKLKQWNNLKGSRIYPGQSLKIYK